VEAEHQLFGFLTTEANAIVAPIHPKAMLVAADAGNIIRSPPP
jgi:putative SOS response-associated peptidase YedK